MKIVVIGAGASGLMAACKLAEKGHGVLLIEKNEKVGRKIYITGKGKCNLTNYCSKEEFLRNVVNNSKFLYSSIYAHDCSDVMEFFQSRGVELEIQRGNRVFPKSGRASDIIDCLLTSNRKANTLIHFKEEVKRIYRQDEGFVVCTNTNTYTCDKVIVATGGLSYPVTGSTGDGYKIAKSFALNIIPTVPALSALKIREGIPSKLDKFTLKNVRLTATIGTKNIGDFGEITFYSYGLAGPIALTVSSQINRYDPKDVKLSLDFKPALTEEQLSNRIIRECQNGKSSNVKELLRKLLPGEILDWFIKIKNINTNLTTTNLSKETRDDLIEKLKNFTLTYKGLDDIERATVTSGGVDVNEINPSTMECKRVPGLYFIGEVLDVDAFTGGFNLQIAFSTAMKLADKL